MSTLGCTSDGTANQVVNEKFVMSPSHSLRASAYSTSFYSEVTAVVEEIVDLIVTSGNIPLSEPISDSVDSQPEANLAPDISSIIPKSPAIRFPVISQALLSQLSISVVDSTEVSNSVNSSTISTPAEIDSEEYLLIEPLFADLFIPSETIIGSVIENVRMTCVSNAVVDVDDITENIVANDVVGNENIVIEYAKIVENADTAEGKILEVDGTNDSLKSEDEC